MKSVKSGGEPSFPGRLGWQAAQLPSSSASKTCRPRRSCALSSASPRSQRSYFESNGLTSGVLS